MSAFSRCNEELEALQAAFAELRLELLHSRKECLDLRAELAALDQVDDDDDDDDDSDSDSGEA